MTASAPTELPEQREQRFFYGWVVVLVCFLVLCLVFGVRLSFGIFFEALTRGGEFDWSRGDTAGVFSLSVLIQAFVSAQVGWLLDRLGARRVFSIGLLVIASGLFFTSQVTNLRDFYLFFGVWVGLGTAILGLSVHATTISRWFSQNGRRGLAIGLAYAGTGAGILVLAPILEQIIARFDWRLAYLLLAALAVFLILPLTLLLLRDTPADLGLLPDSRPVAPGQTARSAPAVVWTFRRALGSPVFWLLMLAGVCSLFTLRMVTVHQVAHMVDQGVPRLTAATIFGSAGLITALAYIGSGALSDRIGRERTFYIGAGAQVLALTLLITLSSGASPLVLYVYALLWGLGEGSRSNLLSAITSDTFGGPHLGTIVGTLGAFFGLGAGLGSWAGGIIYDVSGSYLPAFGLALLATALAVGSVFAARLLRVRVTSNE